jgi:hypothetical protein
MHIYLLFSLLIEDLYSLNFSRTQSHIKAEKLKSLVNGFTLIEVSTSSWALYAANKISNAFFFKKLVNDLERKYYDGQSEEDSDSTVGKDNDDTNDDDKDNNH